MKRSAALAALSRDHHQALIVAQQLRRATVATAAEAREAFLAYWADACTFGSRRNPKRELSDLAQELEAAKQAP